MPVCWTASGRFLRRDRRSAELQLLRWKSGHDRGQLNTEDGSTFLPVVGENFSAVLLNDAEANAEAQARALANRFRRIEWIENALRVLETGTGVGEQNDHVGAVADRLNGQDTAVGGFHGFQGVADDVEENLHQLISISANAGEDGLELQLDARRPGAQVERAELHGVVHHGVDVEERALSRYLARETQEIANQCFCTARLIADL